MCEKIKRAARNREAGSAAISRFLPLLIVIVSVSMLLVTFSDYIRILDIKDEISLTMRKYVIRMETAGYLTVDDEKELKSELSALGVTGIDLSGTTMSEVEYGGIIYLHVKGTLNVKVYSIVSIFEGSFGTQLLGIDEVRSSTSQQ